MFIDSRGKGGSMSILDSLNTVGNLGSLFDLLASTSSSSKPTPVGGQSFSNELKTRLAELQSGAFQTLLSNTGTSSSTSGHSIIDFLAGTSAGSSLPGLGGLSGLTAGLTGNGFNLSLSDPASAFAMMTKINSLDATYKAQFAELSEMGGAVESLESAGESLGEAVTSTSDANTIKSQLQTFVDRYNAWVKEFDGTVAAGGMLNGTQAAEVSLAELRIAVENRFNGAAQGVHGLSDLGITIDENTHLATFDTSKLDSALSSNQAGVVAAIDQFSANFTEAADLLTSDNNFVKNRLANLDRVIDYISANGASLKAEFGTGAAARLSDATAKALAAYNAIYAA